MPRFTTNMEKKHHESLIAVCSQIHAGPGRQGWAGADAHENHQAGLPGTWDTIYNKIGDQFLIPNALIEEHCRQLYEAYGDAGSGT